MNRIKQLRNEKNITQKVLANYLGLEIAGVSKLETGRVPLKDEYIIKLANYFNVSSDYLLGNSDIRNSSNVQLSREDLNYISKLKSLKPPYKEILKNFIDLLDEQSRKNIS